MVLGQRPKLEEATLKSPRSKVVCKEHLDLPKVGGASGVKQNAHKWVSGGVINACAVIGQ